MEHTQGPWKAEFYECGEDPEDNGWLICHPRTECPDTVVCKVDGEGLNNAANAELIARAPELLEENEALKARIAELEAERKWQPIETAPKDGTGIIGMSIQGEKKTVCWIADGYMDGDRWVFASFDLDEDEYTNPTHWMPLPKMTTPETLSG